MGRKYKGDTMRFDDGDTTDSLDEAKEPVVSHYRPLGIDPETSRRAQAIALRQIQVRMPAFYGR